MLFAGASPSRHAGAAPERPCARAPVVDYRCRAGGALFNRCTGTIWAGAHYTCACIAMILRGFAQGAPTLQRADESGCDDGTLLAYRHEMQAAPRRRRDASPLADAATEADAMFQNAGEKGDPQPGLGDGLLGVGEAVMFAESAF